jgi:hypothetical protein
MLTPPHKQNIGNKKGWVPTTMPDEVPMYKLSKAEKRRKTHRRKLLFKREKNANVENGFGVETKKIPQRCLEKKEREAYKG